LLPTPAKSHYLFNLRDFSRVINGVLMMPGSKAADKNKVTRLWAHEVLRVFNDRLTTADDREWLHGVIADITKVCVCGVCVCGGRLQGRARAVFVHSSRFVAVRQTN
jgi:hypothetical protein